MHLVLVVWIAPHIRQMPDVRLCVSVCLCIRALKSNIRTNLPLILYMCMSISLICCMYDVWCMLYAIHHSMSDVLMNDRYFDSLSLSIYSVKPISVQELIVVYLLSSESIHQSLIIWVKFISSHYEYFFWWYLYVCTCGHWTTWVTCLQAK